jgi:secondary thiamine-phosphate synthase enzyme
LFHTDLSSFPRNKTEKESGQYCSGCANLRFEVKMKKIEVRTQSKEAMVDITGRVIEEISSSGIQTGICSVYVPHTTAGVTLNENADPSVKEDILMTLQKIVPDSLPYKHSEGNSPAHVKASLIGSSVNILIDKGQLSLGTWQGIIFCEFDGPRNRRVFVNAFSS